jgi:hypothetical protein
MLEPNAYDVQVYGITYVYVIQMQPQEFLPSA